MAEPAGGVLPRLDQGGADAAPLEPLEDLEMVEHGHAWEVVADLGLVGRAAVQEHVADRPAVEPGDQQHPASVLLPGQPVGEELPLPEDRHQRGEIGRSGSPDLHRTQGSAVVRHLEAAPHPATLAGPGDHVTAFSPRP
jgi:hypothetical protein